MGDAVGVGVGEGLAELTDELDAGTEVELEEMLSGIQVEALFDLGSLEQQRRTPVGLDQVERDGQAVVAKALHRLELSVCLPAEALLLLLSRGGAGQVDTHPTGGRHPWAGAEEVLPTRALVEELAQLPVAGLAASVRWFQPGLLDGCGDLG